MGRYRMARYRSGGWLSFEPFESFARAHVRGTAGGGVATDREIEEAAGLSPRTISQWRKAGAIPYAGADHAACGLGVHPAFIWRGEYFEGAERPRRGTPAPRANGGGGMSDFWITVWGTTLGIGIAFGVLAVVCVAAIVLDELRFRISKRARK